MSTRHKVFVSYHHALDENGVVPKSAEFPMAT